YTTHNKTYSTGVLLKAFVKAKFEMMLLMMCILFAPVLYTLSQGTLLVADWNDSWALEVGQLRSAPHMMTLMRTDLVRLHWRQTRRAFNDHSACYLLAFRPHKEHVIPAETLEHTGTSAKGDDADEVHVQNTMPHTGCLQLFRLY